MAMSHVGTSKMNTAEKVVEVCSQSEGEDDEKVVEISSESECEADDDSEGNNTEMTPSDYNILRNDGWLNDKVR